MLQLDLQQTVMDQFLSQMRVIIEYSRSVPSPTAIHAHFYSLTDMEPLSRLLAIEVNSTIQLL